MTVLSLRGMQLGIPTMRIASVISSPVNSVPAAISASAVIGTAITVTPGTWTNEPTLTYQWQRNTGSWVDISGATDDAYTPVDADFGYALQALEIPNGNAGAAVASNTTGLTLATPSQTVGSERVVNGDMSNAASWSVGANWSIASGVATATSANNTGISQSSILPAVGSIIHFRGEYTRSAGTLQPLVGGVLVANLNGTIVTPTPYRYTVRTTSNQNLAYNGASLFSGTVDNASAKQITPPAVLNAPSANMSLTRYYTLPVSPEFGTQVWVMFRVSSPITASGNYWLALLDWNGSQWNLTVHSVSSHTRAAASITANNIGATNGINIVANGDDISVQTTANGGANWTSRGSTSSSTWNTATGVQTMQTPDVTGGDLIYTNP